MDKLQYTRFIPRVESQSDYRKFNIQCLVFNNISYHGPLVQKILHHPQPCHENEPTCKRQSVHPSTKLPTPETHGETGSVHPKRSQKAINAKMLILLFYVLKRCFLGSLWVDRPSLSVSFRSGQFSNQPGV